MNRGYSLFELINECFSGIFAYARDGDVGSGGCVLCR